MTEEAKKKAAVLAVDQLFSDLKDSSAIGIGSGSTIVFAVEHLAKKLKETNKKIFCVPSSFQASQLIRENGLNISSANDHPELEFAIDGADEIDSNLHLIKGGGGAHLGEKVNASIAKKFYVIADYRKESQTLGTKWKKGIPLEVLPGAYVPIMKNVEKMFPNSKATLRIAEKKAGPVITDNGNLILDVDFGPISDPAELNTKLLSIPGVLETGLFIGMTEKAYIGLEDGSVQILSKDGKREKVSV